MGSALGGGQQKVIDYYASYHVGLCVGPIDAISGVLVGKRYVFPFTDPNTIASTYNETQPDGEVWQIAVDWQSALQITTNIEWPLNLPNLFGGDQHEGGVVGKMGIFLGGADQVLPFTYTLRMLLLPENCPAYRGIASVFFVHMWNPGIGFMWSTNSPIIQETQFTVTRQPKTMLDQAERNIPPVPVKRTRSIDVIDTAFGTMFQNIVHDLYVAGPDANPAHIIYECLVSTDFGLGMSPDDIDIASFADASTTLFNEGLGLSFLWATQQKVQDFVNEVEQHVDGKLFVNPATGLLTFKLVRAASDAMLASAVTLDESNSTISNFQRKSFGDLVNEITVTWTNPFNEQGETVVVQNLAALAIQGHAVTDNRSFTGCRNPQTATSLGMRELRSASSPLVSCDIVVNASGWSIVPTDIVRLNWPEYGAENLIFRVMYVDYGKSLDTKVKLTLVQDIFSEEIGDFVTPLTSQYDAGVTAPSDMVFRRAITLPAFILERLGALSGLDIANAYQGVLSSQPITMPFPSILNDQITNPDGSLVWTQVTTIPVLARSLCPAMIAEALTAMPSVGTVTGGVFSDPSALYGPPYPAMFGVIGEVDDAYAEIVMVQSVALDSNNNPTMYFLVRGCLDTVPRAWPSGTAIYWLSADDAIYNPTVQTIGASPLLKLQTRTGGGTLDLSAATAFSSVVNARPHLPTRPAGVSVGGVALTSAWYYSGPNPVVASPAPTPPTLDPATGLPLFTVTAAMVLFGTPVVVSWANRNRLVENSRVLFWTDGDVTGEDGQTTRIRLTNSVGAILREYVGISGTSFSLPVADLDAYSRVIVHVYAECAGMLSLQAASFVIITPHITTIDSTATIDSTLITVDASS